MNCPAYTNTSTLAVIQRRPSKCCCADGNPIMNIRIVHDHSSKSSRLLWEAAKNPEDFVGQAAASENRSRLRIRESRGLTEVSGKKTK